MKVSIIINCHNGDRYLRECLESVLSQSYKNFEVIFFDNKSNDQSKNIFLSYKEKKFKYFYSNKKINLYKARNRAIKLSKGNLISFLDVDDWWEKNKLKIQVNVMKNKKIDIIYSNYFIFKEKYKLKKIFSKLPLPSGYIFEDLINNYNIGILTVMIRKKIFKKRSNFFDNKFNIMGDYDLFVRLAKDYRFKYLDKPLATYREHSENYSNLNYKKEILEFKYWITKKFVTRNIKIETIQNLKSKYLPLKAKKFLDENNIKLFYKYFRKISFSKIKIKLFANLILKKLNIV